MAHFNLDKLSHQRNFSQFSSPSDRECAYVANAATQYRQFVACAARNCRRLSELDSFLSKGEGSKSLRSTTRTTLVEIPSSEAPKFSFTPPYGGNEAWDNDASALEGDEELEHLLRNMLDRKPHQIHGRLFIIENPSPGAMCLLGGAFDIDPQMFTEHLHNGVWYFLSEVREQIPPLRCVKDGQDFHRIEFISPRVFIPGACAGECPNHVFSDSGASYTARKAGKLCPMRRYGTEEEFEHVLLPRQSMTIWFGGPRYDAEWNGIILLDPPFRLDPSDGFVSPPIFRPFLGLPSPATHDPGRHLPTHLSLRTTFLFYLSHSSSALATIARACPFVLTRDLLRTVASEWTVACRYVERELVTVEHCLERADLGPGTLEHLDKELFVHARRAGKYRALIAETRRWCAGQGQLSWPCASSPAAAAMKGVTTSATRPPPKMKKARSGRKRRKSGGYNDDKDGDGGDDEAARAVAAELDRDFEQVSRMITAHCARIARNQTLLGSLIAVGEGKESAIRSRSLALLAIITTVFLPFTTVAAILGINTRGYGPGGRDFWVLWVVAMAVLGTILGLYAWYEVRQRRRRQNSGKLIGSLCDYLTGRIYRRLLDIAMFYRSQGLFILCKRSMKTYVVITYGIPDNGEN
ncbi:hypothetical protein BDY21DRAFT_397094 [Lineolata rhizophorae]|uniref:Cora-like Mg2+ transporter protein-domain-containing protein n=1 Tax=Lineolata rhizophorae TaxID=578093 RepID=A0A6A6NTZ7_9PEZI|nr:hypothetical protein BDY21DRAFT_397094 [Lineolata rhizophorae]